MLFTKAASELIFYREVIANDLSPGAVEAIRRNVELNGLDVKGRSSESGGPERELVSKSHPLQRTTTTIKKTYTISSPNTPTHR